MGQREYLLYISNLTLVYDISRQLSILIQSPLCKFYNTIGCYFIKEVKATFKSKGICILALITS